MCFLEILNTYSRQIATSAPRNPAAKNCQIYIFVLICEVSKQRRFGDLSELLKIKTNNRFGRTATFLSFLSSMLFHSQFSKFQDSTPVFNLSDSFFIALTSFAI